MTITVRFAPSPTGKLHVGNLRTALVNWLFARAQGGKFILRIDDTDLERSSKAYEHAIEADLQWLGLTWDHKESQSSRFARYDAAIEKLKASGHLYPCYETADELDKKRKLQRLQNLPPVYDRAALSLTDADKAAFEAEGRKPHWRFKLTGQAARWTDMVRGDSVVETASVSDPVLVRADGAYLYTLSSVVDDIEMHITHIIRGEDHVTNTGAQVELFRALGAEPPIFAHMPLLVGADGQGLSKRLGSLSIESLREEGLEPLALCSVLARLGTSEPMGADASLEALVGWYQLGKMSRAPARFDPEDLWNVNAHILHAMPYADAQARLATLGCDFGEAFWLAVRANVRNFADVTQWADVVRGTITPVIEDAAFIATAARLLPAGELTSESWKVWTAAIAAETGAKGKSLFMPLRLALTGHAHGPDMAALLPLIGRDGVVQRLGA